ncbi:hypothetical protein FRZ67_00520 [Panacibacter ginsenosidivorans]|uniref:Uncharacterized protein n=1 Tax=Panacibacter ginsenosidivorans TaxID=1813871 RepID=A0A5B8V2W6_9BACT|nr:hypothetical protein [Panacibacter ginsenosidivorans]QEC65857.1 hypothetical protein FRZ67_00520 [Panacibacter ginsenosidivorans]
MNDYFTLSVTYKNKEKEYQATLLQQGYSYKIIVLIGELEVYFEPDEERKLRVVTMPGQDEKYLNNLDKNLLSAISEKIEEVIK